MTERSTTSYQSTWWLPASIGLALLLFGFVVWATSLALSIGSLRLGVTSNVRSLIQLQKVQRQLNQQSILPLSQKQKIWEKVHRQITDLLKEHGKRPKERSVALVALTRVAPKIHLAVMQSMSPSYLSRLVAEVANSVDASIRLFRQSNAALSRQLSFALDRLYLLVVSSIGLAASCFVLFLLFRNKARKALLLQQSLEEALNKEEQSRQEANEANRSKSKFLAMMSHEFRTPLNGISGAVELMQDSSLDTQQRELSNLIQHSSAALLDMVNDVLDFSRIEADGLQFQNVPFSPRQCLQKATQIMSMQAMDKGLGFDLSVAYQVPDIVLGDPIRLRQVLINLLANAIKYSRRGIISLRLESVKRSSEHAVLKFTVCDQGVGMSTEETQRVFFPFYQVEPSSTDDQHGTGLGLAICQNIVHEMGGEIGVESTLRKGSTFWFTLPVSLQVSLGLKAKERKELTLDHYEQVEEHLPQTPSRGLPASLSISEKESGLHILVVEDNPINRRVVCLLLETWGHTYQQAENGEHALGLLHAHSFDLILMDSSMPVMDGPETTRIIRSKKTTFSNIPIVALTAWATPEEQRRCLNAGMDYFLTKPIERHKLEAALNKIKYGEESGVRSPESGLQS